jgi:hypothetical protein
MPEQIRKQAYAKFGQGDLAYRYEPDDEHLIQWYREHRDQITRDMKDCHNNGLYVLAYRKFGYAPEDRRSELRNIALKATIKHGFTAIDLADVPGMRQEKQRLYLRYHGLACEAHTRADVREELSGAVRRILRRGHRSYCRLSDLLAFGQPNEFFQEVLKDSRPESASELSGFFLVALDTIAANPDIAIEYQVYLKAFFSGTNLQYSSKLLDFAIQNRKGLEASRNARFDAQGLKGIAQKEEESDEH